MTETRPQGNAKLKMLVAESGWSYQEFARAIRLIALENGNNTLRTNKSAVAHWIAGVAPGQAVSRFLAQALTRRLGRTITPADCGLEADDEVVGLDLSPDLIDTVVRLGRMDLDRREILAATLYSFAALAGPLGYRTEALARSRLAREGKSIGKGEVDAVNRIIKAFSEADEILGGQIGRSALIQFLVTDVATYCSGRFERESDRVAMFSAAAAACYLIGFKSYDAGLNGATERYYLQAFRLACESDPMAQGGYLLRALAQHSIDVGPNAYGVHLAEAALSRVRGRVDPETESLFWLTLARAAATDQNRFHAMQALSSAERSIERAHPEERPNWLVLGGPAEARLTSHTAKTLMTLGDYAAAEKQFGRCATCWSPKTHPRVHGLTLAGLGEAQCRQGKVEQACDTWMQVIDEIGSVQSGRTRKALVNIRLQISAFRRRGIRGLDDIEGRVMQALRQIR